MWRCACRTRLSGGRNTGTTNRPQKVFGSDPCVGSGVQLLGIPEQACGWILSQNMFQDGLSSHIQSRNFLKKSKTPLLQNPENFRFSGFPGRVTKMASNRPDPQIHRGLIPRKVRQHHLNLIPTTADLPLAIFFMQPWGNLSWRAFARIIHRILKADIIFLEVFSVTSYYSKKTAVKFID